MTSMTAKRQRGWFYPWIIVAFFAVVISVNGFMIYVATGTFTGLETEGHYVKGLNYNKNLEGVRKQAALGWTDKTTFVSGGKVGDSHKGELKVNFSGKDGNPLSGLTAVALITRPTHSGYDFEIALSNAGNGLYSAPIILPLPGQWDARILASRGEQTYQRVQRFQVK
jgi:nitrogen fixation protein FixH